MSLPRTLFAPAFRHQHLGSSFAAIIGIMVFIASFATAAESVLLTQSYLWGSRTETRLTVEIPALGDETSLPQSERVKQVVAILRAMPEISKITPVSDDEVYHLLQPWFDQPELLKALPLPALIGIERKEDSTASAAQIQTTLKTTIPDVRVDDHGAWTRDIWRLVRGLSMLGGLMIALTGVTLVVAVSLICRAVVAAEHETISLLHLLGANDSDIARHFQSQSLHLSLRAAGVGFALALLVATGLIFAARDIIDAAPLQAWHWVRLGVAVAMIPVGATLLAATTARLSVLRMIRSFP